MLCEGCVPDFQAAPASTGGPGSAAGRGPAEGPGSAAGRGPTEGPGSAAGRGPAGGPGSAAGRGPAGVSGFPLSPGGVAGFGSFLWAERLLEAGNKEVEKESTLKETVNFH